MSIPESLNCFGIWGVWRPGHSLGLFWLFESNLIEISGHQGRLSFIWGVSPALWLPVVFDLYSLHNNAEVGGVCWIISNQLNNDHRPPQMITMICWFRFVSFGWCERGVWWLVGQAIFNCFSNYRGAILNRRNCWNQMFTFNPRQYLYM